MPEKKTSGQGGKQIPPEALDPTELWKLIYQSITDDVLYQSQPRLESHPPAVQAMAYEQILEHLLGCGCHVDVNDLFEFCGVCRDREKIPPSRKYLLEQYFGREIENEERGVIVFEDIPEKELKVGVLAGEVIQSFIDNGYPFADKFVEIFRSFPIEQRTFTSSRQQSLGASQPLQKNEARVMNFLLDVAKQTDVPKPQSYDDITYALRMGRGTLSNVIKTLKCRGLIQRLDKGGFLPIPTPPTGADSEPDQY